MGKSKAAQITTPGLPIGPWVYVNDPRVDLPNAKALQNLLPASATTQCDRSNIAEIIQTYTGGNFNDCVNIVADNKDDEDNDSKIKVVNKCREATIKHGCNFASVNLYLRSQSPSTEIWGTNHLDLCVDELDAAAVAEKVYKWLFKAFTVLEHLHLIPEKEMLAINEKAFPTYEYCPISECRTRPKDAKIQFVALVISKPEIGPTQRLQWTVADRTGVANFYFQWRGPDSKYTWDWVLKLQPGDRKALPRMRFVKIKEKKRTQVFKAPFRGVALALGGAGFVVTSVGKGLCAVGQKVKMGSRSEWVPEADVKDGKKGNGNAGTSNSNVTRRTAKAEVKIFNEKGEKLWRDDDSIASTQAGSLFGDEKTGREFC